MDGIELASRPADYPKFLPMQLVTRCPFMVNIHLGGRSLCFSCRLCFNVSRKKGFGCLFSVEITYFSFFLLKSRAAPGIGRLCNIYPRILTATRKNCRYFKATTLHFFVKFVTLSSTLTLPVITKICLLIIDENHIISLVLYH